MKRVFVVVLALVVPGIALWSCASPTDDPFGPSGGAGGDGGSGPTTTAGQGGNGQGGMIGQGGATSSTTAATTTAAVTTTTTGSGGGCNQQTCLTQCLGMLQCGVCENGMCVCVPFDQCDILDGGIPDVGIPDVGLDLGLP